MSRKRSRLEEPFVDLYFGSGKDRKSQRKDAQLCSQIADALNLALADSADEDLGGLWVIEVEPAPHIGHLSVLVQAGDTAELRAVQSKLEARAGHLRHEVARAIHRKRTPSLSFIVVPRQDEGAEDES